MDLAFLNLSAPSLEWLSEKLSATSASPFKLRLPQARPSTPDERSASAERELAARGVTFNGTPPPSKEAAAYRDALTVLAQPESLLRVRVAAPGQEPSDVAMVMRQGKASLFLLQDQAVMVGPARDLDPVVESFLEEAHQGELQGQQILLWPAALKLLSFVWGREQDAAAVIPRREAESRLQGEGRPAEKVAAALDEMVQGGILLASAEGLQIVAEYRPWLDRVWSGHAFQLEYLPLVGAPSFEEALAQKGPHLLFMGRSGDRILNEAITGEALQRWLKGARPTEEQAIRLAALPQDALRKVLRMLVGLEQPGPPPA